MTKLPLLGCRTQSLGVPVIIPKDWARIVLSIEGSGFGTIFIQGGWWSVSSSNWGLRTASSSCSHLTQKDCSNLDEETHVLNSGDK